MPKLPKNMFKRGRSYYFRQMHKGRMQRISLGSNYTEALTRLRSFKSDGGVSTASTATVGEAARRWLSSYVPTVRSARDQRLAAQRVRDYLEPFLGHLLLSRVSPEDIRAYRLHLEKQDLSLQSVRHVLSDLRCVLNWCHDCGLIDASPFPRRVLPKIQERPPDRLTDEEVGLISSSNRRTGSSPAFWCRQVSGGVRPRKRSQPMFRANRSSFTGRRAGRCGGCLCRRNCWLNCGPGLADCCRFAMPTDLRSRCRNAPVSRGSTPTSCGTRLRAAGWRRAVRLRRCRRFSDTLPS